MIRPLLFVALARSRDVRDAVMGRPTVAERDVAADAAEARAMSRLWRRLGSDVVAEIGAARALLGDNPPPLVQGVAALRAALDASRADACEWHMAAEARGLRADAAEAERDALRRAPYDVSEARMWAHTFRSPTSYPPGDWLPEQREHVASLLLRLAGAKGGGS